MWDLRAKAVELNDIFVIMSREQKKKASVREGAAVLVRWTEHWRSAKARKAPEIAFFVQLCSSKPYFLRQSPASTNPPLLVVQNILKTLKTTVNDGLPPHRQRLLQGWRYACPC